MVRPRPSMLVLGISALSTLVLTVACSSPPEQGMLQRYFQASRARDNATLANIATVGFNPAEQGVVQDFEIVSMGEEQRRSLRLKDLAAAAVEAQAADDEFNIRKKAYQDENLRAIERVLAAEAKNGNVTGADATVQEEWTRWRDETSEHARALADARQALQEERGIVDPSVYNPQNPPDSTQFDGELVTKDITIMATVQTPDGPDEEKQLHVRFSRSMLTNGPGGESLEGRWIITYLAEAPPPPVS